MTDPGWAGQEELDPPMPPSLPHRSPHPVFSREFALVGLASPLVLALVTVVHGAIVPGYSHMAQAISELAALEAQCAGLMRYGGLAAYGVLMTAFAIPLRLRVAHRTGPWPSRLIAVGGLCMTLAGIFPCDPGCPQTPGSASDSVHTWSAMIGFMAMMAAPFSFGASFTQDAAERRLFRFSSAMGGMIVVAFLALVATGPGSPVMGLCQRLFLASHGLWMGVVALALFRGVGERSSGLG